LDGGKKSGVREKTTQGSQGRPCKNCQQAERTPKKKGRHLVDQKSQQAGRSKTRTSVPPDPSKSTVKTQPKESGKKKKKKWEGMHVEKGGWYRAWQESCSKKSFTPKWLGNKQKLGLASTGARKRKKKAGGEGCNRRLLAKTEKKRGKEFSAIRWDVGKGGRACKRVAQKPRWEELTGGDKRRLSEKEREKRPNTEDYKKTREMGKIKVTGAT